MADKTFEATQGDREQPLVLRACPFCRGRDVEMGSENFGENRIKYAVVCLEDECGAIGPWRFHRTEAEYVWQQRGGAY